MTPAERYRASFDMLRADYLAAIAWPPVAYPEPSSRGATCTHDPAHVARVPDPRPGADPSARVRVLLDCLTRPAHPSIDQHGVTR